ncbi:MAG: 4Fe-4S dicluster domain-containing protein [Nitrospinaceae bacterium]|jgi:Fe-S oxidoreductase/nitrate reductase gamma subunit|nr:4Fe-4S dicluster domain-containing protein [Nitrospinaceae bacterium]MBT3435844.1 4Fe-4S dicluster domain-containing protein [Nitrospinaceae bacterium]MBT4095249.1 4Fe-4S dicluster domain-containing protein [Nitrospinaceae bacterium]MBT4432533.1 4Fe-4S dicluster domain-containing protein [Nitrospinaceae bacterium]MBT5947248.1 4Fe-4S dicluster domain-containing protein [Nitrospinaceae bacterium]
MFPRKNICRGFSGALVVTFLVFFAMAFSTGSEAQTVVKTSPEKIFECTTCHNPHEFPKFAATAKCQSCHTEQVENFATHIFPMYLLAVVPLIFMFHGIWSRYRLWRLGGAENRLDRIPERICGIFVEIFGYRRLLRDAYPGFMHLFIFYGFLVELLATGLLAFQEWSGIHFLVGNTYLWFSLLTDTFGLIGLIGIGMAIWRRAVIRPDRINSVLDDWIAISLLALIFIQGFVVEGARIAATELSQNPSVAVWSPVGYVVALFMKNWGPDFLGVFHRVQWWFHAATAFTFLGYLGFGKVNHVWYGIANIFFRNLDSSGKLSYFDIEGMMETDPEALETLGTERIEQYSWKNLLDLDACTNCGRCESVCPAYGSGVPLSPRKLIRDLKDHLTQTGPIILKHRAAQAEAGENGGEATPPDTAPLFGEAQEEGLQPAILEEVLWGCRTCGACQRECPVFIEHIPKMVDMRRYLVMMESKMSDNAQQFLKNMDEKMHPWAGAQHNREEWYEDLDVKVLGNGEKAEYLFWVGCTGSMIDRNILVSRAMVKVLQAGGVDFGILGPEEVCTGDPARRAGGEFTFQMCAKQNIATLDGYGVKKIITTCPHCFNTYKNEYPDFGGNYEVIHHTQLISELIKDGKLKLKKSLESLTYHDPCYLARHNGVVDEPREILLQIAGKGEFKDLERSKDRALCCGSGGGYAWMDDDPTKRINHTRLEDVKACGAKTAAVSCPFCMQMFDDALKALDPEKTIRAADIAELVAEALED